MASNTKVTCLSVQEHSHEAMNQLASRARRRNTPSHWRESWVATEIRSVEKLRALLNNKKHTGQHHTPVSSSTAAAAYAVPSHVATGTGGVRLARCRASARHDRRTALPLRPLLTPLVGAPLISLKQGFVMLSETDSDGTLCGVFPMLNEPSGVVPSASVGVRSCLPTSCT